MQKRKALALISGGLDSLLAAKLILDQGIHVEGINFFTGFCGKRPRCANNDCNKEDVVGSAKHSAKLLGIELHRVNVFEEYKQVVLHPKYGYGANLNPCLDCRIFMMTQAVKWIKEHGFDFIISGEVVGQRPKSQLKHMLPVVEKQSGVEDRLLRPLCAKLLAPTLPEREGWVKRELLLDISGRSRKRQMELAEKFGFKEYAQPSGGCCFLVNSQYCARLRDLWDLRGSNDYTLADLVLLKIGRHIRPKPNFKLIIGRNAEDNAFLEAYASSKYPALECAEDYPGPLCLVEGELKDEDDILLAARIVARYVSSHGAESVKIAYKNNGIDRVLTVKPLGEDEILAAWMVN